MSMQVHYRRRESPAFKRLFDPYRSMEWWERIEAARKLRAQSAQLYSVAPYPPKLTDPFEIVSR